MPTTMPKFASKAAKIFQDMQCICRIHFTGGRKRNTANRDIAHLFIQFWAASVLIPVQLELMTSALCNRNGTGKVRAWILHCERRAKLCPRSRLEEPPACEMVGMSGTVTD
jgi:hypothetical protein